MKTYEEIANKIGLASTIKLKYVTYMRIRWSDEEEIQCLTGYAEEWAYRFLDGREYQCSDTKGKEILIRLDSTYGE